MHLYKIPKGVMGYLYNTEDGTIKPWVTRTELSFVCAVIDPVKLHNGQLTDDPVMNDQAAQGNSVFGGEYGCNNGEKYYLSVPYRTVKLL